MMFRSRAARAAFAPEEASAPAPPLVLLAGGGTGGHVFPLVAVADALRAEADVRVVFVGTPRGIESRVIPARGDELILMDVLPIKGGGVVKALRGTGKAALALPKARAIVKRLSPKIVLSVGGYAAGPIALAARMAGVPVTLLEPNSELGFANRCLIPVTRRAYVAFPEIERLFRPSVVLRTGVPLRGEFASSPYEPRPDRFRVLVLGGSQGAAPLNERVPAALCQLASHVPELSIVHQAGRDRDAAVRDRYLDLGIGERARVVPFLDDVAGALAEADLVIMRAGASSLAELCAVGRAGLLIPFAHAAADHQRKNADSLAGRRAAIRVLEAEATPERLAAEALALARNPDERRRLARAAGALGSPDAAGIVARDLLAVAGIEPRTPASRGKGSAGQGSRGGGSRGGASQGPRGVEPRGVEHV